MSYDLSLFFIALFHFMFVQCWIQKRVARDWQLYFMAICVLSVYREIRTYMTTAVAIHQNIMYAFHLIYEQRWHYFIEDFHNNECQWPTFNKRISSTCTNTNSMSIIHCRSTFTVLVILHTHCHISSICYTLNTHSPNSI